MKRLHTICLLGAMLITPFAHAEENKARQKSGEKGKNKPTLPVLTEGKAKGYHAYYEGDSYIAKVDGQGMLELTLKDAGQASVAGSIPMNSKKMWTIDIGPGFYDTKWKKRVRHPITAFFEQSEPSDNASKVRIVCERATGITFEWIYEFSPEAITTWYKAEKGSETPKEQILHLAHRINRIECSEKDRKKSKYEQKLQGGKRKKFDFLESAKVGGSDSKSITIEGPFWGDREITFERGKDEDAEMKPVKYGDVSLRNGSSIWLVKNNTASSEHEKERVTIHIK